MDSPTAEENVYNVISGDYMEPNPKYTHCYNYPELPPGREELKPIEEMKPTGDMIPLEENIYIQVIDDPIEKPTETDDYLVPSYHPDVIRPVYATLETDAIKKSEKKPTKMPQWWVWVLILLGVSILVTLIILVVVFIQGSPPPKKASQNGSLDTSPLLTKGPGAENSTDLPFIVPSSQNYPPVNYQGKSTTKEPTSTGIQIWISTTTSTASTTSTISTTSRKSTTTPMPTTSTKSTTPIPTTSAKSTTTPIPTTSASSTTSTTPIQITSTKSTTPTTSTISTESTTTTPTTSTISTTSTKSTTTPSPTTSTISTTSTRSTTTPTPTTSTMSTKSTPTPTPTTSTISTPSTTSPTTSTISTTPAKTMSATSSTPTISSPSSPQTISTTTTIPTTSTSPSPTISTMSTTSIKLTPTPTMIISTTPSSPTSSSSSSSSSSPMLSTTTTPIPTTSTTSTTSNNSTATPTITIPATSSSSTSSSTPASSTTSGPTSPITFSIPTNSTTSRLTTSASSSISPGTVSISTSRSETTAIPTTTPTTTKGLATLSPTVVVSSIRVSEGALSAKTYCEFEMKINKNKKLSSGSNVILQNSSVNTEEKCREACMGPAGDALLPSGETCMAGAFDSANKQCILTNSIPSSQSAQGWVYFQVEYHCYSASTPGCKNKFSKTNNRQLAYNKKNKFQLFDARSVPKCADECSFLPQSESQQRCQGFIFEKSTNSCTLFSTMKYKPYTELIEVEGTDIYKVVGSTCVTCKDLYPTLTSGNVGLEGIPLDGSYSNAKKCRRQCDNYSGSTCYGFDYNSRENTCIINTGQNYSLVAKPNTDNYRRDIICYECSEPTKYISTVNTRAVGGRLYQSASFNSPYWCGNLCQGQSVGYNSPTCYGFSFNHTTKACTLYHEFDFELGAIGNSPGIDTYRRLYQCMSPESCKENYSKTGNAASITGGILQPKDINTVAQCMDRCWGYAIGTKHMCYGFDFEKEGNTCRIHTNQTYTLSPTDGTDSYKRNMDCKLPY